MSNIEQKTKKDIRLKAFLYYLFVYGIVIFILGLIVDLFVLVNIGFSTILGLSIVFLFEFIKDKIKHNKCIKCKKNRKVKIQDEFDNEVFNPDFCFDCNNDLCEDLTLNNPINMKDFM